MARSKGVSRVRSGLISNSLEIDVDDEGRLQIKCRPMFRRELNKIMREVKGEARLIVATEHSEYSGEGPTGRRRGHGGALESSIQVGPIRGINASRISGSVTAGSRLCTYAKYVHDGTRAHIIRAHPDNNAGGHLVFNWRKMGGIKVVTRSVRHPGSKGSKFLTRAGYDVVARYKALHSGVR